MQENYRILLKSNLENLSVFKEREKAVLKEGAMYDFQRYVESSQTSECR